jgi:hypothetical protein
MGYRRDEFDDEWAGFPEQPERGRSWPIWLAAGGAILLILCLCAAGSFLFYQEFLAEPAEPLAPVLPTITGGELTVTVVATPPSLPTSLPPSTSIAFTPIVVATATLPGQATPGQETPPPVSGGNVEAVRLSASPVIDGFLSEWAGAPAYSSAFRVHNAPGWDGTADLTAVWRLAWDESNLYIGVEVTDNIHVQTQSNNQVFRGDSLDMQFDTNRPGDFGDGLSPDDYQIIFSPGDFAALPEAAFRFRGDEAGRIPDFPGHNVILKAPKTATGYTLEAASPWQDIGLTPAPGLLLGLALNANDNDTPGTAVQEVMMSHVSTRTLTNPAGWGTLLLR